MNGKVEFTIIGKLPRTNDFLRMNRWDRKKLKDVWWFKIKEACQLAGFNYIGNTSYFKEKVKLSVTRYVKDKRGFMDEPNLRHMVDKIIVDQLVDKKRRRAAVSLLPDDSRKYLEWGRAQERIDSPERIHLRFEIEEEE